MDQHIRVTCKGKVGVFEIIGGYTARESLFNDFKQCSPGAVLTIKRVSNGAYSKEEKVFCRNLELEN